MSLLIVGFATDHAKNVDVWERTLVLHPTDVVPDGIVALIKRWEKQAANLALRLRSPRKKKTRGTPKEIPPMLAAIRPQVEYRVSAMGSRLLCGGVDPWERAAREYRPMMAVIARSLSPGFTSAALKRRSQISSLSPNMRTPDQAPTKGKGKGASK